MSGGIEETSASFEARSAPRSYPTPGPGIILRGRLRPLKRPHGLLLQLRFSLTAVASGGGFGLVSSSPVRPGHDKAGSDWGPEQKSGQKIADLGHCRQKRREAHQIPTAIDRVIQQAVLQQLQPL